MAHALKEISHSAENPRTRLFDALETAQRLFDSGDLEEQALNVRLAFENFLSLADLILPENLEDPGQVLDLLEPALRDFELELGDRGIEDVLVSRITDEVQFRVYLVFSPELLAHAREQVPDYLRFAERRSPLRPDHEMALIRGLHEPEEDFRAQAQELLFYQYVNLIRVLAHQFVRYYPGLLDVNDLVEDGILELLSKFDRHKVEYGLISTFVRQQIWARLTRASHLYVDTVTLPEHKRARVCELIQAHWRMASTLMHAPSWSEVANELGWTLEELNEVRGWSNGSNSLRFDGFQICETPTFDHVTAPPDAEVLAQLHELRSHLTPREDEVFIRMGLFGESSTTIAPDFEVTSARIRQIWRGVMEKLKALAATP